MSRSLASLLRLLLAPSARKVTIKRLVQPRDSAECVATHESNGLLITREEAEILIGAGAVDRREYERPSRQLQKRRREYVVHHART